jgi:uncharacterized protein (DUF1330 family)
MKTQYAVVLAVVGFGLGAGAVQGLHAQAKPPVYLISEISVTDADAYAKEYGPPVRASIKASGGHLLALSPNVTPMEGDAPKARISIIQWDGLEQLKAWRSSQAYKDARQIGDKYAKFRSYVVDGLPQ